jgi:hypothetical protein
VSEDGHVLALRLERQGRRPRRAEVELVTRPRGAPLWIDGTRGGRLLPASEIRVGAAGSRARRLPLLFPNEEELAEESSSPYGPPPPAAPGVSVWLVGDGHVATLDRETRETLKALGYLR